jgi:hypothetical protein
MERVGFITTESGTDLIVSFAIPGEGLSEVKSLTLIRTPKYEFALPTREQGVSVSHDDFLDEDEEGFDVLKSVELDRSSVRIITQRREYTLDIQEVNPDEIRRAAEILHKMNFDQRFLLKLGPI